MSSSIRIGVAGWQIPKEWAASFPSEGSHLSRYSRRLPAVEINTTFYRDHQASTYEKWAAETPDDFRFVVKLSREITHNKKLNIDIADFRDSLQTILNLKKLGGLLAQLPPSLEFEAEIAEAFFIELRTLYSGMIAVEPRNASWAAPEAVALFDRLCLTKVIADPERCPWDVELEGLPKYYRLHGSPDIYKSSYSKEFLENVKEKLTDVHDSWVIFDNTQFGKGTRNALDLISLLKGGGKKIL